MSPPPPNPQVLYNPLWLIFLLLLFLFGKTVYQVGEARALVRRCRVWPGSMAVRRMPVTSPCVLSAADMLKHTTCSGMLQHSTFHPPTHITPPPHFQQEMDVEREMQRGLLPGAIALSSKFVPALKKVTAQTIDSARRFLQEAPEAAGAAAGGRAARGSGDGGDGAARRQGHGSAAGLRSRGRREVELSEGGGFGAGTSRFATEAAAAGSRKDD